MPRHDDHTKPPKKNEPLTPIETGNEAVFDADLDKTQLHTPVKEAPQAVPQRTSRIPEPVVSKKKKVHKKRRKTKERPHSIFKPRTKNPNFVLSVMASTIRLTTVLILCACLALAGVLIGIAKAYVDTAPTLDLAALDSQDKTSFIYDSKGNLITDYKGTEDRVMVSIDEIPDMLRNAFIAVEDARFYEHTGVDVKRIVGALVSNFTTGST